MDVIKNIFLDLVEKSNVPNMYAMQKDANTRTLKIFLFESGLPWNVPEKSSVSVAFHNLKDGHKGWYDKLPNGDAACTVNGNVVTAILAPAVLSGDGEVQAAIVFQDAQLNQLATFGFSILVEKNPAAGSTIHNDYYAYSTMEEINNAIEQVQQQAGPAIVFEASGEAVAIADASDRALQGLTICGKTTQNGTPSPSNPVPLVSTGDGGSIVVSITDGTEDNVQTLTLHTPRGLPGIPVSSGGNYTDTSGQQWVCDEIDLARGVYVQRVEKVIASNYVGSNTNTKLYTGTAKSPTIPGAQGLCNVTNVYSWSSTDVVHYYVSGGGASVYVPVNFGADIIEVLCQLATPIETPLDADTLVAYAALHTNKPNTTVLNDAGAGQKIGYVADTKTYIDQKFTQLQSAIIAAVGTI